MKPLIAVLFTLLFFFITAPVKSVNAQVFKLELANPGATINVGDSFNVNIMINTAGQEAINGDALINFENNKVSINSAVNGNFFTYFAATALGGTNNKYLVSSWEESIAHAKSTSVDKLFATLTLTALAGPSTSLSFDCTPGTEADSNINRASDSQDIINCDGLNTLSLTIGGEGSVPTNTPSPTPTGPTSTPVPTQTPAPTVTPVLTGTPVPTNTPLPTVSVLPQAGIVETTLGLLTLGTILTIIGLLAML